MMGEGIRRVLWGVVIAARRQIHKLILKLNAMEADHARLSKTERADDRPTPAAKQPPTGARASGGAPKHWVERVKKYAPELLHSDSQRLFSHDASSADPGTSKLIEEASARKRLTASKEPAENRMNDGGAGRKAQISERLRKMPLEVASDGSGIRTRTDTLRADQEDTDQAAGTRTVGNHRDRYPSVPPESIHGPMQRQKDPSSMECRPRAGDTGDWKHRAPEAEHEKQHLGNSTPHSGRSADAGDSRAFMTETKSASRETVPAEFFQHRHAAKRGDQPRRRGSDAGGVSVTDRQEGEDLHEHSGRQRKKRSIEDPAPSRGFRKSLAGGESGNLTFGSKADEKRRPDTQDMSMHLPKTQHRVEDGIHEWGERGWPRLPEEDPSDAASFRGQPGQWPALPEDERTSSIVARDWDEFWEFSTTLRKIERLRRLEKEQEGKSWSAWLF